jgi:histidinol-phosphate aminotransferase
MSLYFSCLVIMRTLKDYSHNLMPYLQDLEPDEAGPDPVEVSSRYGIPPEKMVVLSRNENPYSPGPKVLEALESPLLNRYPDSGPFVEALSGYTGYPAKNIVTGAGMDEVITTMTRLFLGPGDRALIPVPTYTLYGLAVRLCGAMPIYQQRLADFDVNLDSEVPDDVKMMFLCSPNNPTGNAISKSALQAILESTDAIVFLDEAYAEFAKESLLHLVREHDNLVVGRTMSKAFALAGLRLGYAVAPEWIAEQYRRIAPLFSISSVSLAAGTAALEDVEYMKRSVLKIVSERERMRKQIGGAWPTEGNFLFISTKERSSIVSERLLRRGIIVRDCASFLGAGDCCLRVTVGTPRQNDIFREAFGEASQLY